MSDKVRVRFAPSPTGCLHIGGARTALFNWLFAQHHKGAFILRIEDTDEVRSTPESVNAIVESLHWLGLGWEEGPDLTEPVKLGEGAEGESYPRHATTGDHGPYFQMLRHDDGIYTKHVDQLLEEDKAYRCYCSKEEIEAMRTRARLEKRVPLYDRRCARLTPEERAKREKEGRKFSVRLRMPEDGTTLVPDLIRGNVQFDNQLQQDLVIQKQTGGPTYNFACVVDDHLMEITHVIRGDEHLSNTPSQIAAYRALGWEPPKFAHLSMILGPDKKKLSKRHGTASVTEYRDKGYLPEALRNYLALLGWATSDSQNIFGHDELIEKFAVDRCQKSPAVFDPEKLNWMNGEYVRKLTPERLLELSMSFLKDAGLANESKERLLAAVKLEQDKVKLLSDVPGKVDLFFKPIEYREKAVEKVLLKDGAPEIIEGMLPELEGLGNWSLANLEQTIRAFAEKKGLKAGKVFHPLRVGVSGRTEGPGLFELLALMGKDESLKRLKLTLGKLKDGSFK